ncbi:MAG: hypothetical protein PHQ28_05770 [Mycobacterium sp.]|nr:hypothetical protein [Mycobacterium sp.]
MRNPPERRIESDPARPANSTWWSRLVDGAHPWGSFDATISRYGVRRYRLIIYPAGMTAADRRVARLWRGWPLGGAVLVVFAVILLGDAVAAADTVLALAVACYVGIGAMLFVRGGPARVRVRSLSVTLLPHSTDANEQRRYTQWQTLVGLLIKADHMLMTGDISPVEHEAAWWEAYNRLGVITYA